MCWKVVVLRLLEGTYHGALVGLQQLVWYNGWTAVLATLRHGGAALVVLYASPTIEAFFLWQIGISTLTVVIFALRVHRAVGMDAIRTGVSLRPIAEVWRFAAGASTITMVAIVLSQIDKVLLSRLITLEAFGVYMLASSVASALYLAVVPLAHAIYPRMVELVSGGRTNDVSVLYHRSTAVVAVMAGTCSAVLFIFPAATIFVWSGDPALAVRVAPVLAPAALGTFLHALTYIPYQLQLAHGWTSLSIRAHLASAVLYLPLLVWTVPRYGGVGAAWLWVALNLTLVLTVTPLMHRRLLPHEFGSWMRSGVLLPFGAAVAIALAAGFVLEAFDPAAFTPDGAVPSRTRLGLELAAVSIAALAAAAAAAPRLRGRWVRARNVPSG